MSVPDSIILNNSKKTILKLDHVMYFEADNNGVNIITNDATQYYEWKKLKVIEELLEEHPSFMRVHRSYIIHRDYVKSIKSNQLSLINSQVIPIGITLKSKVHAWIKRNSI